MSTSVNLNNESQTEKYKDLRALLQLLTNSSSKDLVVYLGLHIITPLMSVDLLKCPKLSRQYFTLLAHMLEVYPEKVAKLSPEGFARISATLEFGLRHQNVEVVSISFTALNAVAFYHYQAICRGQEGLGIHALSIQNEHGVVKEGVLDHFLRSVMQFLLFDDYSNDLVELAADALLPLVVCNTALYRRLALELLKGQHHALLQSRLATAFHVLLNANQVTSLFVSLNTSFGSIKEFLTSNWVTVCGAYTRITVYSLDVFYMGWTDNSKSKLNLRL